MSLKKEYLPGVLVIAVIAIVWMQVLVNEVRLIKLQDGLVKSVESGDLEEVIFILDELDPDGTGTVSDWTGAREDERSGFVWLLPEWRRYKHTDGADVFFERWAKANPAFPRSELQTHLDWLWRCDEKDGFRDLFTAMLEVELKWEDGALSDDRFYWLTAASADLDLALMAWVQFYDAGLRSNFPKLLVSSLTSPENLAREGVLEQILHVTGLLDPIPEFRVLDCPWKPSRSDGRTWIEWFAGKVLSRNSGDWRSPRRNLEEKYFPEARPEIPGIFLLKCLVEGSSRYDRKEMLVTAVAPGLEHFKMLSDTARRDVAGLLDRHVVTFRDEDELREWVWISHRATWKSRENDFQNPALAGSNSQWRNPDFRAWVYSAARLGHADETVPTIRRLWTQHVDTLSSERISIRSNSLYAKHPFTLSGISNSGLSSGSGEGGTLNREGYQLMLAIAKEGGTPPCIRVPGADEIAILDGQGKVPWNSASVEKVFGMLNELGESFADDPLRFLIVSTFCDGVRLFKTPEELARFQLLAAADESPGGWLADDLADLLPLWLMMSDVQRRDLLMAGGHAATLSGFNQYLSDDRAPVAARMTFALTALPWWYTDKARRMHSERMPDMVIAEPNLDQLTLDFAQGLGEGALKEAVLSRDAWSKLIEDWLYPFRRDDTGVGARTEARELLLQYFKSVSEREIASARVAAGATDKSGLDRAVALLEVYAKLLRSAGMGGELVALLKELEGVVSEPVAVFSWIPREVAGWNKVAALLEAEVSLYDYRQKRADELAGKVNGGGIPPDYPAMTEATATLEPADWISFSADVLKSMERHDTGSSNGSAYFHTLLPQIAILEAKEKDDAARVKWLLMKAAKLPEISAHNGFFSLATLPFVRQILREKKVAEEFLKELEKNSELSINPCIRTELEAAARTMLSIHHDRYLASLADPSIPLAQRWLGANYLLVARFEFGGFSSSPSESWDEPDRVLVETALDLLVEAIDQRLPVWEIADRGLGDFDAKSHQKAAVLAAFRDRLRNDPEGQAQRATALLRSDRLDAIVEGSGERFMAVIHNIAVYAGNRSAADSLFSKASINRGLNERIKWLSLCRDWQGLAGLLPSELSHLDELGAGDFLDPPPDALDKILSGLPEGNTELELLARVLVTPRWKIDPLMNPSMKELPESQRTIGARFLEHTFDSPEIERFILDYAPMRLGDFPALATWIEGKIGNRKWPDVIDSDSVSFGKEWPYWAKYLEVLADSGKFDVIREMLPERAWFGGAQAGSRVRNDSVESREEMVWMGFGRAFAGVLSFGTDQSRLDASPVVAELLKSLPALNDGRTRESLYQSAAESNRRRWAIDVSTVRQLAEYGMAAVLVATRHEPLETALQRSDIFTFPSESLTLGNHSIDAGSYQSFFYSVADLSTPLENGEKEKMYLRAFETKYFKLDDYASRYPCYSTADQFYHPAIFNETFKDLAGARLRERPNDLWVIGDYGLTLSRGDKRQEALPFLERSLAGLDEKDPENERFRDFLTSVIQRVREKQ